MDRKQQVMGQLAALMKRHGDLSRADLERLTAKKFPGRKVAQQTIGRILKGETVTEPERETLIRIAEAVGETYQEAFAESATPATPEAEGAIRVNVKGKRLKLIAEGDVDPEIVRILAAVAEGLSNERLDRIEAARHKMKKPPKH
jgi:transcriptional regulator with XRE-family HTH domain